MTVTQHINPNEVPDEDEELDEEIDDDDEVDGIGGGDTGSVDGGSEDPTKRAVRTGPGTVGSDPDLTFERG